MNKYGVAFVCILALNSCRSHQEVKTQKAAISSEILVSESPSGSDTFHIDPSKMELYWKGTKMRGAGKHEGKINIKKGFLIVNQDRWIGGRFEIDMTSMKVTDIPEHETIPRNNLLNHLKSSDFFAVERYPMAHFQIIQIKPASLNSLYIIGNLTLKDITKSIEFTASDYGISIESKFSIDRFQWNIAYTGNWVDRTFVDKDIEIRVKLITSQF